MADQIDRGSKGRDRDAWPHHPGSAYTTPVQEDSSYAVIVVTHDHAETLPACLDAVAALDPAPAEVVVVDNASSDGSAESCRGARRRRSSADPRGHQHRLCRRGQPRSGRDLRTVGPAAQPGLRTASTTLSRRCSPRPSERHETNEIGSITGTADPIHRRVPEPRRHPRCRRDGGDFLGPALRPRRRRTRRRPLLEPGLGLRRHGRGHPLPPVGSGTTSPTPTARSSPRASSPTARTPSSPGGSSGEAGAASTHPMPSRSTAAAFDPRRDAGVTTFINRLSVRNRFLLRIHCADLGWHLRCFPWWKLRDLMVIGACLTVELSSLPALGRGRDGIGRCVPSPTLGAVAATSAVTTHQPLVP